MAGRSSGPIDGRNRCGAKKRPKNMCFERKRRNRDCQADKSEFMGRIRTCQIGRGKRQVGFWVWRREALGEMQRGMGWHRMAWDGELGVRQRHRESERVRGGGSHGTGTGGPGRAGMALQGMSHSVLRYGPYLTQYGTAAQDSFTFRRAASGAKEPEAPWAMEPCMVVSCLAKLDDWPCVVGA